MGVEKASKTKPLTGSWATKNPVEIKRDSFTEIKRDSFTVKRGYIPVSAVLTPAPDPTARPYSSSFHPDFMRCPICNAIDWKYLASRTNPACYECKGCTYWRDASNPAVGSEYNAEREDILALYAVWHALIGDERPISRELFAEAEVKLAQRMHYHKLAADPSDLIPLSPAVVVRVLDPGRMCVMPQRVYGAPPRETDDQRRAREHVERKAAYVQAKAEVDAKDRDLIAEWIAQRDRLRALRQEASK